MNLLLSPKNGETVSLHTEHQKIFFENHEEYSQDQKWRDKIGAPQFCSVPAPVHFEWSSDGNEDEFVLSASADFSTALHRIKANGECDIYNLEIGKTYFWRVGDSEIYSFTTENTPPRMIRGGAAINVRDIGGYNTLYGRRVKQGLIYRGRKFVIGEKSLPRGRTFLIDGLGLKYELDLRQTWEDPCDVSPLGSDVGYIRIPCDSYNEFLGNIEVSTRLFRFIIETLKSGNAPLYIHCAGGADRTGSVVMLILAVLGVSDDDILLDYETTTLCDFDTMSRHGEEVSKYIAGLKNNGETFHESLCGYLLSAGVSHAEMDELRDLMLEK